MTSNPVTQAMQDILRQNDTDISQTPTGKALLGALNKLAFNCDLPPSQWFFRATHAATSIDINGGDVFLVKTQRDSPIDGSPYDGACEDPSLPVKHKVLIKVYRISTQTHVDEIEKIILNIDKFRASPLNTDYTNGYRWVAACAASWLDDSPVPKKIPKFANFPNSSTTNNATATIQEVVDYIKNQEESYVFICMDTLPVAVQGPPSPPSVFKIACDLVMAIHRLHAAGISFNGHLKKKDIHIPADIEYPVAHHVKLNNIDAELVLNKGSQAEDYKQVGEIINSYLKDSIALAGQSPKWLDWDDGKSFQKLMKRLESMSEGNIEQFEKECDKGVFNDCISNQQLNTSSLSQEQLVLSLLKTGKNAGIPPFDQTTFCSSCSIGDQATIKRGAFWSGVATNCDECKSKRFIKWTTNPEYYSEFKGFAQIIQRYQEQNGQTSNGPVKHDMYYYSPFNNILVTSMDFLDQSTTSQKIQDQIAFIKNISTNDSDPPLSSGDIVSIVEAVENAINNLHDKYDVAHHDIKWENIHIGQSNDKSYYAKLLDLGSSVPFDNNGVLQYNGMPAAHSPLYAAPEINQLHATRSVDWFSLGLCALELIIGTEGIALETYLGIDITKMKFEDDAYQLLRYNLSFERYLNKVPQKFKDEHGPFIEKLRKWLSHNPKNRSSLNQNGQTLIFSHNPELPRLTQGDRILLQEYFNDKNCLNILLRYAMLPHLGYRHADSGNNDSILHLYSPLQNKFFEYTTGLITNDLSYRASADGLHEAKEKIGQLLPTGIGNTPELSSSELKYLFFTEKNEKLIECVAPFAAMWTQNHTMSPIQNTMATQSNVNNSNPHNISYYRTLTIARYSISNRTDIKKDKRNVFSYKTDPTRLAAAMFTQNEANDEHPTYNIVRNIAALSDIINITSRERSRNIAALSDIINITSRERSGEFLRDLEHLGATEGDFDEFQNSFSNVYDSTTPPQAFLPLLNDAYWKRLADRHLLQTMYSRCVQSTPLNGRLHGFDDDHDQESVVAYIARVKKHTQLLPIEFGQYYLEDYHGIKSKILESEPLSSEYPQLGKYVWQILKSDQAGFPSHAKIWYYDCTKNEYVGYDSQTAGLCVLYCVAFIVHTQRKIYETIEKALDEILLSIDDILIGYMRRIIQRITNNPTQFDSDYCDSLLGYILVKDSQLHKVVPETDPAKLRSFLQVDERKEEFIKYAEHEDIAFGSTAIENFIDSIILSSAGTTFEELLLMDLLGSVYSYYGSSTLRPECIYLLSYYKYLKTPTDDNLLYATKVFFKRLARTPDGSRVRGGVDRAHILSINFLQGVLEEVFKSLIISKAKGDELEELLKDSMPKDKKEITKVVSAFSTLHPPPVALEFTKIRDNFDKFLDCATALTKSVMWSPDNIRNGDKITNQTLDVFVDISCKEDGTLKSPVTRFIENSVAMTIDTEIVPHNQEAMVIKPFVKGETDGFKIFLQNAHFAQDRTQEPAGKYLEFGDEKCTSIFICDPPSLEVKLPDCFDTIWVVSSDPSPFSIFVPTKKKLISVTPLYKASSSYIRHDKIYTGLSNELKITKFDYSGAQEYFDSQIIQKGDFKKQLAKMKPLANMKPPKWTMVNSIASKLWVSDRVTLGSVNLSRAEYNWLNAQDKQVLLKLGIVFDKLTSSP